MDCGPGDPPTGSGGAPPTAPLDFPRAPGETPRACAAFAAYFALGHARSLSAVADQLGEHLTTVKTWSARFGWSGRIASFHAGILRQRAEAELALHRASADDWARRTRECREQEWEGARKLRVAAQCFLETVGDAQVEKMTLAQASRAIQIAARLARQALSDAPLAETAAPIQLELAAALQKAYGAPPPAPAPVAQN